MLDKIFSYFRRYKKVEVGVAGIISEGDKVLLTKRTRVMPEGGKWCIPGGHVKKWEKVEDTVKREIKEEIGLDVKKSELLFVHEEFVKKLSLHAIVFVFLLDVKGEKKKNWEVSEMKFFEKGEINKLDMAFSHREILNKYFRGKK